MSSLLETLTDAGDDIIATKYYAIATGTILLYDYFLTLGDEVEFAWSAKKKSWIFWIFIANRYSPMLYQAWQISMVSGLQSNAELCGKTVFFPILTFVVCTLLAQVVLTMRIYAVARRNIPVTIGFAVITASQLVLGVFLTAFAARSGAQPLPPIPFDAFQICVFIRHRNLEIAYTSISLFYDSLAFSLIIFLARKSKMPGFKAPRILGTIAEDATRYFLVIFTSHFVLTMTLIIGRETIQLLPSTGNVVYLPVMISRIMLSLKKAADSPREAWSLVEPPSTGASPRGVQFFHARGGPNKREDVIALETYSESQMVARQNR